MEGVVMKYHINCIVS